MLFFICCFQCFTFHVVAYIESVTALSELNSLADSLSDVTKKAKNIFYLYLYTLYLSHLCRNQISKET